MDPSTNATARPGTDFRAGRSALFLTALVCLGAAIVDGGASAAEPEAGVPNAPDASGFARKMTFIGDSTTAGFGFCGTEEAADVRCELDGEMENRWQGGGMSLQRCAPKEPIPDDSCANDNFGGKPWTAGPWKAGPGAPHVAYPFQIAARHDGPEEAEISDWAIAGSTPAQWEPDGGVFGSHLDELKDQYVGMTLGAFPVLSYFTNYGVFYPGGKAGPCVDSTGSTVLPEALEYFGRLLHSRPLYYVAGKTRDATDCQEKQWDRLEGKRHLVNIFKRLLAQGDRVVVMGYPRGCPWSYGNWQPKAKAESVGPAEGEDCKDRIRDVGYFDHTHVSQWEQATAVGTELNILVKEATTVARERAREMWPGTDRDDNLVFALPDQDQWEAHRPKGEDPSWVLLSDTWMNPNRAGAANLATTIEATMCARFHHWCPGEGWE